MKRYAVRIKGPDFVIPTVASKHLTLWGAKRAVRNILRDGVFGSNLKGRYVHFDPSEFSIDILEIP